MQILNINPVTTKESSLGNEIECLFDYLYRMSGDKERAQEVALESHRIMRVTVSRVDRIYRKRVLLYKTARSFLGDIWYRKQSDINSEKNRQGLIEIGTCPVQSFLDRLDGETLEFVMLRYRYDFSIEDIAAIMGKKVSQTIKVLANAQIRLDQNHRRFGIDQLKSLKKHSMDIEDTETEAIENDLAHMKSHHMRKPGLMFLLLFVISSLILMGGSLRLI